MMIEQPAARAGAIFRVGSSAGKFQAAKAATTPIGSRRTRMRVPAECPSTVRP
jgi:hypothetical protein